jgi:type II secretory pathway component PulJ
MTLIELMVSLTFSSIVIMLAMKTQGPQRRAIIDLRDRAYAAAELKLASEWLRHDLAAGDQVSLNGQFLHIEREGELSSQYGAWTGSWDLGIGYRLDGKNLLRINWKTAEAHAVATGLTAFDISNSGNTWTIHIAVGTGFAGRTLDLIWKN